MSIRRSESNYGAILIIHIKNMTYEEALKRLKESPLHKVLNLETEKKEEENASEEQSTIQVPTEQSESTDGESEEGIQK